MTLGTNDQNPQPIEMALFVIHTNLKQLRELLTTGKIANKKSLPKEVYGSTIPKNRLSVSRALIAGDRRST